MHPCPTCDGRTISSWKKSNASSPLPARCGQCGGLSHVNDSIHAAALILTELGFWGSIVLAIVAQTWWPLLLVPLAWAGWVAGVGHFATLIPINEPSVAASRRAGWRVLLIFAMLMAVGYAIFGAY
jgi:hypothetical protein